MSAHDCGIRAVEARDSADFPETQELYISNQNDGERYPTAVISYLPPGIRLCRETPDGTPWELFGRIMLHLHNLGPLREGDADAFTTFIRQNRPEVKP